MALAHPAFLVSLAALAVPVIIHLSRRRKFKELSIGSLRFLRLAAEKRNLRLRIEDWPLLLLRLAALALLALLFTFPYPRKDATPEAARDKTIILLDASGSMTPAMADRAKSLAKDAAKSATSVTYARFADEVETLKSLDDYQAIPGAPTDFTKAMTWTLDHLRMEGISDARVVIIGHFAANALPPSPPRVWPPRVIVETHAIEPPAKHNQAVRGLESLTPYVTRNMEVEAWLTPSDEPREVFLAAEGLNLQQTVPAGVERAVFSFRPPRPEMRGKIWLEGDDPWPADDARPFALRWTKPVPVLLLDGSPGSTPFEGQAYFIDKALAAAGAAHGQSPFQPEIRYGLENRQGTVDLSSFHAAALCGPAQVSSADARTLASFVASGKGLLIVLDGRWNATATRSLVAAGLLPENLELRGSMALSHLNGWDTQHPALAPFSGRDGLDLRSLKWRSAFSAEPGSDWKTLAKLDGGQPLLLEKTNAGRVVVLLHPLTREWSDVPVEPLFVPFAKALVGHLADYQPAKATTGIRLPGLREPRAIGIHETADGPPDVVVPDAAESSVAAVGDTEFRKAFGLPDLADQAAPLPVAADSAKAETQPADDEWWPWLALGLLALLCVECAVATRSVSPPRTQPAP